MRSVPQRWISSPSRWGSVPDWNHVPRCCEEQTCAPAGAGWEGAGRRAGAGRWGGGALSLSFFKTPTVIFRVLCSLWAPRWSEWERKWVQVAPARRSGGSWSPRKRAGWGWGRGTRREGAPAGTQPVRPSSCSVPWNAAFRLKKGNTEDDAAFLTYTKRARDFLAAPSMLSFHARAGCSPGPSETLCPGGALGLSGSLPCSGHWREDKCP